jgi:phosphatidate cytidylyltransferase
VIIWVADIFAYFGGRQFGRHKLAPSISPGKTREGALIGLAGVLLWMLLSAQWAGSYAADVMGRWGVLGVIVVAVLLGSVSVLGDLFESLLKRRAGVKDSGRLLPGHGGVYDRVDAVVAVVPVAYLLVYDFWHR